jgi:NAD(P)-dependent dehydrogenase (short-subunit alcohol dehydrogenase family)
VVTGLHMGYVDTDMTTNIDSPKMSAQDAAQQAIEGIATNSFEVLADDIARMFKAALSSDIADVYTQLAAKP